MAGLSTAGPLLNGSSEAIQGPRDSGEACETKHLATCKCILNPEPSIDTCFRWCRQMGAASLEEVMEPGLRSERLEI